MNKLAFLGVIILGLVLLVTHLVVTFIIGAGPLFVAGTCDVMSKLEVVKDAMMAVATESGEELAVELKETVEQSEIQDDATKDTAPLSEKGLFAEGSSFEENDVDMFVESLNEKILLDSYEVNIPLRSWTYERIYTYKSKFPTCVIVYGLVGSLLIICGTVFVAIALLRGTKTMKEYKSTLDSTDLGKQ